MGLPKAAATLLKWWTCIAVFYLGCSAFSPSNYWDLAICVEGDKDPWLFRFHGIVPSPYYISHNVNCTVFCFIWSCWKYCEKGHYNYQDKRQVFLVNTALNFWMCVSMVSQHPVIKLYSGGSLWRKSGIMVESICFGGESARFGFEGFPMSRLKDLSKNCEVCCPYRRCCLCMCNGNFLFCTFLVYLTKLFYFFFSWLAVLHIRLCRKYRAASSFWLCPLFGSSEALCVCVSIRHMYV